MADGVPNAASEAGEIVEDIAGTPSFEGRIPDHDPLKVDGTPAPDGVPEKFWDAQKGALNTEALLKSYAELEKRMSAPKEEAEVASEEGEEGTSEEVSEETTEETTEESEEGTSEEAPAPLTAAVEAAQKVFAETGDLPADARAELHALGINDQMIDLQIAGARAFESALKSAAAEAAQAPYEEVEKAIAWAAKGWSPKKVAAFNAQSGDVETIGDAVVNLMRDYRKANPSEGRLLNVKGGTNAGDVYSDRSEFDKELADAGTDRTSRRKAVDKLNRSLKAGTIK